MRFSLVPQKEVNIQRSTGTEMDSCAALEFFYFQESMSFPQEGCLSRGNGDRRCRTFELRTIGEERKAVKLTRFLSLRRNTPKTEPLVPLILK